MSLAPRTVRDRITYYKTHLATFYANAEQIGTSTDAVAELEARTEAARIAFAEQSKAMQAAKAATANLKTAMRLMQDSGASIISQVRGRARIDGDTVFTLAGLDAPASPSTLGKPGTPFDYHVELLPTGTLRIKWKCRNPEGATGTIYQVYRRVGESGENEYLGGTGKKSFDDDTIPAGATKIVYEIQGTRSTAIGDSGVFIVNFGSNQAVTITSARLAA